MKKIVKKVIPVLISLTMLLGACGSDKTAESPKENQDVQIQEADAETQQVNQMRHLHWRK